MHIQALTAVGACFLCLYILTAANRPKGNLPIYRLQLRKFTDRHFTNTPIAIIMQPKIAADISANELSFTDETIASYVKRALRSGRNQVGRRQADQRGCGQSDQAGVADRYGKNAGAILQNDSDGNRQVCIYATGRRYGRAGCLLKKLAFFRRSAYKQMKRNF